jgi:hypothetical protein
MVREALHDGIASGAFCNSCLSNLPTLAGLSLEWQRAHLPEHVFRPITDSHIDPYTGKPFGYSPVTPAGRALCLITNTYDELDSIRKEQRWQQMFTGQRTRRERPYFWLWRPHAKYPLFVTTELERYGKKYNEVSWYYQTFIEYLTPGELEQERRYRASHPQLP